MSKDGCRNTPYSSAIEYYNYNILPNDIKGNLKSSYEELDNIFDSYYQNIQALALIILNQYLYPLHLLKQQTNIYTMYFYPHTFFLF